MKSGKLAKRKKNYNLVQVCCSWCGAQVARCEVEALERVYCVCRKPSQSGRSPAGVTWAPSSALSWSPSFFSR